MEKMTYISALNDVLKMGILDAEHTEKFNSLIARLEKQAEQGAKQAAKRQTAKRDANAILADRIYNTMVDDCEYTVSEIIDLMPFLADETGKRFSTQKVSPMMTTLCGQGKVERKTAKGGKIVYHKIVKTDNQ